jgi:shikimate dehydrogenase
MRIIDAHTDLICLFGHPAKHSLSPVMHNAAFESKSVNAVYLAFEIDSIEKAIQAVRTLPIKGASVTIPFKTDVMQYLDEIDENARRIGAVNTIVNCDGILHGYNTDGYGACSALACESGQLKGRKVLVLGSGGASRAVSFTMLENETHVTIASRMGASQDSLVNALREYSKETGSIAICTLTKGSALEYDIIINTTPLGMKEEDPLPIPEEFIAPKHTVFDIVYHPADTKLLIKARERGAKTVNGIEMLVRQGVHQFELWTGKPAPFDVMKDAIADYLK